MSTLPTILLGDPDPGSRAAVTGILAAAGFAVRPVGTVTGLVEAARSGPFDCAIVDLELPDVGGISAMSRLREVSRDAKVIMLAGSARVEIAAAAFAAGADDYLAKRFAADELVGALDRVLRHARAGREADNTPLSPEKAGESALIGSSPRMVAVYKLIARTANLSSTVLITGETGSGKEQVARAIHNTGSRADKPFVAIDCASIPESLFESEFFGHEKGAFTGAHAAHRGVLEAAGEGTCFLDEVGELPLHLQAKLLRALQERAVRRVGSARTVPISARIICATNRDLAAYVARGAFREDLYYRLNVVPIQLPALRERPEDIPGLVRHFLGRFTPAQGPVPRIDGAALDLLVRYAWPGNVRQLENAIERTVALTPYPVILPEDLPAEIQSVSPAAVPAEPVCPRAGDDLAIRDLTRVHIDEVLRKTGGNKLRAARMLGIDRRTLYRILERTSRIAAAG